MSRRRAAAAWMLCLAALGCKGKPRRSGPSLPPGIPAGWLGDTRWSRDCPIYVPPRKELLPDRIAWSPCPGALPCRAMVTDWSADASPIGAVVLMDRNPDGSAVLGFSRISQHEGSSAWLSLAADADGPVRSAIGFAWPKGAWPPPCYVNDAALNGGMHVLLIKGDHLRDPAGAWHQSALGGAIDTLQPLLLPGGEENRYADSWRCGSDFVYRLGEGFRLVARRWSAPGQAIEITDPGLDPEGLRPGELVAGGRALFWATADLYRRGENVWTPDGGARPFIRWAGDLTRGAYNLGTDGKDLVWTYGEGKRADETDYPRKWIMTAPFTTDPSRLAPRRLRPQPTLVETEWKVGCGFAIHSGDNSAPQPSVLVVRLADGVAWTVAGAPPLVRVLDAVGVTCQDAFVLGTLSGRLTVLRFRFADLGAGS